MDGDNPQLADDSRLPSLNDALVNSINIVEEFDTAFGQFFQYCIDNFLMLSENSQLSSSMCFPKPLSIKISLTVI